MVRILLVEDSKFVRLATERALARVGYDVVVAADGESALELARMRMPHLILLDMLLPKVTGPEVLKALKSDPVTKGIPVVVLTGMSQKNEDRLRKDGAFGFLCKQDLALETGSDVLLQAVADILRELKLNVPTGHATGTR